MYPYWQVNTTVSYSAIYISSPMLKAFAVDLTDFSFDSLYNDSWGRISTHLWELRNGSPHRRLVSSFGSMDDLRAGVSYDTQDDLAAGILAGECAHIAKTKYWAKPDAGYSWSTEILKIGSLEPAEAMTEEVFAFHGARITTLNIV